MQLFFRRQFGHDAIQPRPRLAGDIEPLAPFQRLHLQREILTEQLGANALGQRHGFRRIVVTGNQPPQLAFHHDGNRHGRIDAHVLQVLTMHRRDGAKLRVAHVQRRFGLAQRRQHRLRRISHVRDHADPVALVEFARLHRNIGRRKMLVQEAPEVGALLLRDHTPCSVMQQLVDHHAVIADHQLDHPRGRRSQLRYALLVSQPAHQRTRQLQRSIPVGVVSRWLEFQVGPTEIGMHRHVEPLRASFNGQREHQSGRCRPNRLRRCVPHRMRGVGANDRFQRLPNHLAAIIAEHLRRVGGSVRHRLLGGVINQHRAMRLDRARNVDRFAVAVRQVGFTELRDCRDKLFDHPRSAIRL